MYSSYKNKEAALLRTFFANVVSLKPVKNCGLYPNRYTLSNLGPVFHTLTYGTSNFSHLFDKGHFSYFLQYLDRKEYETVNFRHDQKNKDHKY